MWPLDIRTQMVTNADPLIVDQINYELSDSWPTKVDVSRVVSCFLMLSKCFHSK